MKQILTSCFLLLFSIVLNNNNENFQGQESVSKIVSLNLLNGYKINNLTGDTIRPLINSSGDTIYTGVPLYAKSEFKVAGSVNIPLVKKAIPSHPIKSGFGASNLTQVLPKIPYKKSHSKNFYSEKYSSVSVLLNTTGDTIKTGVQIPVKGKQYNFIQPKSTVIQFPERKEHSNIDIQFIDVEQGLSSSCVISLLQDKRGNIWFGTDGGGVSVYNGVALTHYNNESGLQGKNVREILEDSNGNLWFATEEGISKFDGRTFTQYSEKEGLTNNRVLCLAEDKSGNIWCGTNGGGVTRFDGENFIHYSNKEGVSNIVRDISEDSKGNLWFSSYTEGIFKYNGKTFEQITTNEGLNNNSVSQVYEDKNGNLWIATWGGGFCKFDGNYFTCFTEKEGLINNNVNSIAEDEQGNIWVGTWEGFSKFDGNSFTNFSEENGLTDNDVFDLMFDNQQNLWLGTWSGGVNILNSNGFVNFTDKNGLNNAYVLSMIEDENQNIWVGNWDGLNKFYNNEFTGYSNKDGLNHEFGESLAEDTKGNIWIGGENGELTKFDGKSFTCFTENFMLNNSIISILSDKNGILWMGTKRFGLCKFDGEKFEYFDFDHGFGNVTVNSIAEDQKGNIWIATGGFGVLKYNGENFTFYSEKEGLSSNDIISIFENTEGVLYFGTNGGGLNQFDGNNFIYLTTDEGLSSNNIRSITQDQNNNIWVGTDKGLNCVVKKIESSVNTDSTDSKQLEESAFKNDLLIIQYNFYDGLKDIECNRNSILFDSSNRLWIGTRKSLSMMDLDRLEINWNPVNIKPDRLEINEKFVDFLNLDETLKPDVSYDSLSSFSNYPKNLQLKHNNNHLSFYFASSEFKSPQHVKYSYKIAGINKNWSVPSVHPRADYQNVPDGQHTFMVKAMGQNQVWSEVLEYSFSIKPHWGETRLALFFYLFISIILIYYFVKWRTQALNRRKNELIVMVEELQHAKAKAEESEKLKGAFLLNLSHEIRTPMNGILGFTNLLNQKDLTGEQQQNYIKYINESGSRMLNTVTNLIQISRIETGQVDVGMAKVNLIKKVRELCDGFVSEAERKSIQFNYSDILLEEEFEVETDISKFESILKHLINNAIKYTDHGTVEIGFLKEESNTGVLLQFSVSDTGIGIPQKRQEAIFNRFEQGDIEDKDAKQGTGIGLSIARAYAHMLSGEIWVESEEGKGSTFFFTLPVKSIAYQSDQIKKQNLSVTILQKQGLKVLIAEDDEMSSLHLSILLKDYSSEILYAFNGEKTVQEFNSNPDIDLILMDIKMPLLSGIEATKKIREFDKNVIIIAQTAYAMPSDKEMAIQAGCNDYITKPIDREKLFELLNKYLKIERK